MTDFDPLVTNTTNTFNGGTYTNPAHVPTVNDLGVIVSSGRARKIIYGGYVLALVAAGGAQVAFADLGIAAPAWLSASVAVLAYLGIPVGGLAAANTRK
ncbi:hypothetical protein SAMN05428970_2026 [Agromyces sp. CF514]|uniref:hypothetical protein n=1 Tax=Agromyces sp. CF514 TaxID=1881031 RepID=UPI0008DFBCCB|nr:hypothetical protein [Agromyces sp. CF514]SFR76184.1 hypothetical protein SAMN05428970_2026 [Agromyces sp. CF514]